MHDQNQHTPHIHKINHVTRVIKNILFSATPLAIELKQTPHFQT